MTPALRILFAAEPARASEALAALRQGGPVEARLAPSADVLRQTLAHPDAAELWDAVVYLPGGAVGEVEVAAYVPGGVPLFVVGDGVPVLLSEAGAEAVGLAALAGLHARLAAPAADAERQLPAEAPPAEAPPGASGPGPASEQGRAEASAAPLASLADHLAIGLYRSSPDGRVLYANPALARLLGVGSVAELDGLDVRRDLGYPRDAFLREVETSGVVRNLVVSWTRPSGEPVHTRENARAVRGPDGVLYYEGTMEDVTAEVEARREERAVARQHRAVAAFAAAAAEATDADTIHRAAAGALLDATGAAWACLSVRDGDLNRLASTVGRTPAGLAEALGPAGPLARWPVPPRPVSVGDPSELDAPPDVGAALAEAGVEAASMVPVLRASEPLGVLAWGGACAASPAEVRGAEALAWHVGGHLDRAEALRELRDTEASLAMIADRTPHVLYRLRYTDGGPVYDYLSPAIETLTGYSRADLDARGGVRALVEHREVFEGQDLTPATLTGDARYHGVYRMRTARGPRWVEDDARPWLDPAGRPVGYVGILQDVTERKEREHRLADEAQAARVRQRALVDLSHLDGAAALGASAAAIIAATLGASDVSFWLCPPDGPCRALYAPPADGDAGRLGADLAAVVGHVEQHRTLDVADTDADPRVAEMGFSGFVDAYGLRSLLVAPIRRDGRVAGVVVVHHHEPHAWDAAEREFAGAAADALALALEREERERVVAELDAAQQRYRALAEMTSDYAFAVTERDGRLTSVQWAAGACSRITGYTLDELFALGSLRDLVHPDSQDAVDALAEHRRTVGEGRGEIQIIAQSGETRWVDHHVRVGGPAEGGGSVVYHSGQDVTDRKAAETALVSAREEAEAGRATAERMNQLKSSFLANMGHEIRTPLTGILGFADLLAMEVDEEQRPFVDYIERNGVRLLDTLNAVLDLSQLEAGEYQATIVPGPLAPAVRAAAGRFEGRAADKGLRFDLDLDEQVAAAVDATALSQIAGYLISNAVKFTDAGGVFVSVEGTPSRAVLRIADTGVGISEAFLPAAFDAFRQEEDGHDRSHEGSGLGLTVVWRLVELLDGDVEIESEKPGGTVVTVTFPRAPAPVSARPSAPRPRQQTGPAAGARPAPPTAGPQPARADVAREALLDAPFDFTFLSAPVEAAAPPPTPPPALTDPTAMFDFRFGRSTAPSSPPADTAPPDEPAAAAPPAPAAPDAPPVRTASPAPARPPVPARPLADPGADPVMIVRSRPQGANPAAPPASPARPSEAAGEAGEAGDGRPSVLVVEDNDDTRMLLDRILRSTYHVTAVGDARSALLAMNERRFAGLVLDINLGGKETGADVLRIARSLPNYDGVFAIALTAYALPGDRERLLESGFNEYISKPFTRQSLMDTLAAGVQG